MKCPKCGVDMVRREGQFYWRGDSRPGWVCVADNALWAVAGEEIEPLRGKGLASVVSESMHNHLGT